MTCSLLCIERVGCSQRSCEGHHFPAAFVLPGACSRAMWYPSDRWRLDPAMLKLMLHPPVAMAACWMIQPTSVWSEELRPYG